MSNNQYTYTRGCHHSGWTQDREDLLKKLHGEGLSASQIATRITATGFDVTRNAVIGKANRMGLTGGDKPRRSTRSPRKRQPKSGNALNMVFGGQIGRKSAKLFLEAEPFTPGPELVIPLHERKTLLQLEDTDCRWGIGDPKEADFHFCGKAKVPGLPYCEHHCRRAYQPPQERRKRIPVHYLNTTSVNDITRGVEALQNGDAPINTREKQDA
jgi:GcrA cell cycle regulator